MGGGGGGEGGGGAGVIEPWWVAVKGDGAVGGLGGGGGGNATYAFAEKQRSLLLELGGREGRAGNPQWKLEAYFITTLHKSPTSTLGTTISKFTVLATGGS